MAARDLTFQAAVRPVGGLTLPNASHIVPTSTDVSLGYEYGFIYAVDGSTVIKPFYMPWLTFLEQASAPAVSAGQAALFVSTGNVFKVMLSDGAPAMIAIDDRGDLGVYGIYGDGATAAGFRIHGYRYGAGTGQQVLSGSRLLRIAGGGSYGTAGTGVALEKVIIDLEADGDWTTNADLPGRVLVKAAPDASGTPASVLGVYGTGQRVVAERNGKKMDTDYYWETRSTVTRNNSAAEQDLVNTDLTTADFKAGDRVRLYAAGDCLFNSGTPTLAFAFRFAALNLTMTAVSPTPGANRRHWFADIYVTFVDTIDASCIVQIDGVIFVSNAGTVDIQLIASTMTYVIQKNSTAVDLSADTITMRLTEQMSVANSANEVRLRHAFCQRLAL